MDTWSLQCDVTLGPPAEIGHMSVRGKADLRIFFKEENEDDSLYWDGLRIEGELIVDVPFGNTLISQGKTGIMRVSLDGETTIFPILFVEMVNVVTLVPNKLKRYFWFFYGIEKPRQDRIGLFPDNYRKPDLKVFLAPELIGKYSEISAIIVAKDKTAAKDLLDKELAAKGLSHNQFYDLCEVDQKEPSVVLLNN